MRAYQQLALVILFLFAIGTVVHTVVPARQTSSTAGEHLEIEAGAKKDQSLFEQHCVKCHGSDGKGQTTAGELAGAPDFTDGGWQQIHRDSELRNSITHGNSLMPAFGKKLGKSQINSLVRYVRAFRARARRKELSWSWAPLTLLVSDE